MKETNGIFIFQKKNTFWFSIKSFSDTCHDHFRIDKEQSMLIDCQRLFERNEPLDKPDKYGITLVRKAFFFRKKKPISHFCFVPIVTYCCC
jgi:hypothetical protein